MPEFPRYPYLCKVAESRDSIIVSKSVNTPGKKQKGEEMKKIAIPVLAAIVACPAMAGQHHQESFWDTINPYMGLRVGAGYTNHNYSFDDKKKSLTDEEMHGRIALGLAMGCRDQARTEIEWSMFTKMKDDADFRGTRLKVDTKLQTLLMNAYMDLGDYQMVRPFVGMGAGVAFADVTRDVVGVESKSHDQTRFSAMGTMGITIDWRLFAVDMAFRYTYADINSGLHNFGGDIGVRYMF